MHLNISSATCQPLCSGLNVATVGHLDTKGMLDDGVQSLKSNKLRICRTQLQNRVL